MSYSTFEAKENTPEGFRGLVVTMCDQGGGRVDFVTADDERHVIGLADLAFLVRAAASLPRYVLEPDHLPQPQVVQAASLAQEKSKTLHPSLHKRVNLGPRIRKPTSVGFIPRA